MRNYSSKVKRNRLSQEKKLRKSIAHRPILQKMLKDVLQVKENKRLRNSDLHKGNEIEKGYRNEQ
jgi:hypothetical protein